MKDKLANIVINQQTEKFRRSFPNMEIERIQDIVDGLSAEGLFAIDFFGSVALGHLTMPDIEYEMNMGKRSEMLVSIFNKALSDRELRKHRLGDEVKIVNDVINRIGSLSSSLDLKTAISSVVEYANSKLSPLNDE